jgi:hypothetical protein
MNLVFGNRARARRADVGVRATRWNRLAVARCCRIAVKPVAESVCRRWREGTVVPPRTASRLQLEGDLVPQADDAEVATVEGRHFGGVEPLRRGDHGSVNGAQGQVAVFGDELRDADGIAGVQSRP